MVSACLSEHFAFLCEVPVKNEPPTVIDCRYKKNRARRQVTAHEVKKPSILLAAAGIGRFFDRFFHSFAGLSRALLDPSYQFFLLPLDILQVVVCKLGPFLFEFTSGNFPIAFDL